MTNHDTARLKKRISAAFANGDIGSADLIQLIGETETAANAANDAAVDARADSEQLDADPTKAAHAIAAATIEARQLQRAAQQLRDMLPAALNRKAVSKYATARDKLQLEGDALEQKLADSYFHAVETIVAVFKRATEFQDRAARELPSLPPNTATLRKFSIDITRLLEKVQLFDLDGEQLWPPPAVNFAVAAVAAMSFPELAHGTGNPIGPGWELPEAQAQFRAEKDKGRAQQAKRYADMTREQEQRQNAEERQRFAASQQRR
jgi:hypothetical protein